MADRTSHGRCWLTPLISSLCMSSKRGSRKRSKIRVYQHRLKTVSARPNASSDDSCESILTLRVSLTPGVRLPYGLSQECLMLGRAITQIFPSPYTNILLFTCPQVVMGSDTITFNTGASQGRVLFPLLFSLFINVLSRYLTDIQKKGDCTSSYLYMSPDTCIYVSGATHGDAPFPSHRQWSILYVSFQYVYNFTYSSMWTHIQWYTDIYIVVIREPLV